MFAQYVVSGISTGTLYAITALGLALLYKTTGIINFAHGEAAMVTTFVALWIISGFHLPFVWAFIISAVFAFVLGMLIERVLFRKGAKLPHLSLLILTISLYTLFRGLASVIWGHDPKSFPVVLKGENIKFGSVVLDINSLFIICLTIVLMIILYAFFKYTKTGLAMRAVSSNSFSAKLMGIKVHNINAYTWGIAGLFGGIAGMLIAPVTFVTPTMMGEVLIKAFAASVLGGFTSLPGVVLGGLAIGVLENLIAIYISAELKTACIFLLIIIVLAIKPTGLLGKKYVKKV